MIEAKQVCDRKDCVLYGCYIDPSIDKEYSALSKAKNKSGEMDATVSGLIKFIAIADNRANRLSVISRTCPMCSHFEKQDMEALLNSRIALKVLTDDSL